MPPFPHPVAIHTVKQTEAQNESSSTILSPHISGYLWLLPTLSSPTFPNWVLTASGRSVIRTRP